MLLVISGSTINASESARKTSIEGWGHTVTTIQDSSSQAAFDAALASVDVVYIPATVEDWELSNKCKNTVKGVVCEERYSDIAMGFSTNYGWTASHAQTEILSNTHAVTTGLSTGYVTIVSSAQDLAMMNATAASGMTILSKQNYSAGSMLGVIDTGGSLAGGGTAAGRRVRLPWGGDSFSWSALNSNGLLIARQAISWAVGAGSNDLLLYWKLNETSGTTANDSSTYNRDGSITGAASWISARRHNGFDFNGASKIETSNLLSKPTSFTLACWIRIDASDTSGAEAISVGDYLILRAHNSGTGGPQGIFHKGSSTWTTVSSSTSYIGCGWHHMAVTFDDAANSLKLWIDGVNVATTSTTTTVSWSGLGTWTRLGAHGNTNTGFDLDGAIDDARVYSRALTQSEIVELYGLVGHWKLTETSGTSVADSSGRGLNGTYANGPTLAQAGPYQGAGQYAASFDGANDYVNGAAASNYTSFSDGFSIAAWVRLAAHRDYAAILENGATTDSCSLAFSSTGQVRVMGRNSGGVLQMLTTSATLPLGSWKHVVGTYDGATFRCYIDGQLVSSANNAFTLGAPAGNLTLGVSLQGGADYLNGRLHDVRLYNRAIAADEVVELYGLVGHWKLNETSGITVADSSGLGNSGTVSGTAQWTTGAYDNGHRFNYTNGDDYVTVANSSSLQDVQEDDYSFAYWFKPASVPPGAGLANDAVYANVTKTAAFMGTGYTSGKLFGMAHAFSDGTFAQAYTTNQYNPGRWHHVVATVNRSGGVVRVYVNGVLDGTASFTVNKTAYEQGSAPFRLGIGVPGSGSTKFAADGTMDEVRVYNRALGTEEITALYGLLGHWKFDEPSGPTIADSSGNAQHAAFFTGTPSWISTGVYSNALQFSGANDAQTTAPFTLPNEGTVAWWFQSTGTGAVQQRMFGAGGDWEARQTTDGILYVDLCADAINGGFYTLKPVAAIGRWYHIAAAYDCDDETYSLYLDGELHKSGVSTLALNAQPAAQLMFGNRSGTTERFSGALDDFRVYNRKLEAAEVYDLFGLAAWYKLDETSGTVAVDSTGHLNHGTYTASPTLNVSANGASSQGTAVAFNGTSYVQVPGLYDRTSSVSASAWVRLDGVDSSGADVVSLGDYFRLRLSSGSSGAQASYYNGSSWVTATASQVTLNTGWHHFAAVLRGGSTLKLYIDGVEAASTPASGVISYAGLGANSRIATHGHNSTAFDFIGRVDDVRIFSRAMSADEVYQFYRGSRINGLKIIKWVESR